jgi:hypothetical protein
MAAIPARQFSLPLNRDQKTILDRLARRSGLSRADIFRQLLLREHQAPPEAKVLATGEKR